MGATEGSIRLHELIKHTYLHLANTWVAESEREEVVMSKIASLQSQLHER